MFGIALNLHCFCRKTSVLWPITALHHYAEDHEFGCTLFVEFILGIIAETLTTQETTRKTAQEIILEAIRGRLKRVGSARRGEWVIE